AEAHCESMGRRLSQPRVTSNHATGLLPKEATIDFTCIDKPAPRAIRAGLRAIAPPPARHTPASGRLAGCGLNNSTRLRAGGRQRSSLAIFVPSMDTPAMRPALFMTKPTIGWRTVLLSILPLAPMLATATVASAPTVQPLLLRNFCS